VGEAVVETIITEVAAMERDALIGAIRAARVGFEIDFTAEYLFELDMEELRHLVLATRLQEIRHGEG
jgi:hypothetical protein